MVGSLYNYPRLVVLLLFLIVAMGANALINMPRLEDPSMEVRVALIVTRYPGASAERVEALVTEKIELKLREESGIKRISSNSRPGVSTVIVELEDAVENSEPYLARLRDKLAEVNDLPAEALPPRFDDHMIYAYTSIIALVWAGEEAPNYSILGRYAHELDTRLKYLPGTDFSKIAGLPREEISVTFDDQALAAINMTPQQVAARIFGGDPKNTAGIVSGEAGHYLVELSGALDSLERIRQIPLVFQMEGSVTRVGDIATVTRAAADPPGELALIDGRPGVMVAARMHEDMRVDEWVASVDQVLADFSAGLPAGVVAEKIFDQDKYTTERLSGLLGNLVAGAIIVFLVLLVTLGWRASLIAGSILPLASLSALAILYMSGFRIQQMVVTGMIVGLGIMVDNAIVITDAIQTELLKGARRSVAVAKTVGRLWLPLLGSTATTVIAFLPILLMPGNAGDFVGGISGSVIASIIASYVIAFAIISAIAGKVLGRSDGAVLSGAREWWREGIHGKAVSTWFRGSLTRALDRPIRTMFLASLFPLVGLMLAGTLPEQFFPPGDRDQFHLQLYMPGASSIEETQETAARLQRLLKEDERILSVNWNIGAGIPKYYYNLWGGRENMPHYAEAMVTAASIDAVDGLIAKFQPLFDEQFPHAQILVRNLEQGPPYDAPVEVRVLGPDLEVLRQLGEDIRGQLAAIPGVIHTKTTLEYGRAKAQVNVNEDEAGIIGLDLRSVADQLRGALDGEVGGTIIEATEEVPVRIRVDRGRRDSINALENMQIEPQRGGQAADGSYLGTPLSAIADVDLVPSVGNIPRRNGIRVNAVHGILENNLLPDVVLRQLEARLQEMDLEVPPGYRLEIGGEAAERDRAMGNLMATAGVLAVLMVIAVVLTYDSFRLALITFGAAVQAAGLGFLALWVADYPRGFIVIVGAMGLVGLAINAAIVILSELKQNRASRGGDKHAVVEGVMSTGRHILSTTLTTVGGFMPLMLASGEFWPPFAIVIAGGTFLSMIVSFYFAPAAFTWFAQRRAFVGKRQLLAEQAEAIREADELAHPSV